MREKIKYSGFLQAFTPPIEWWYRKRFYASRDRYTKLSGLYAELEYSIKRLEREFDKVRCDNDTLKLWTKTLLEKDD